MINSNYREHLDREWVEATPEATMAAVATIKEKQPDD